MPTDVSSIDPAPVRRQVPSDLAALPATWRDRLRDLAAAASGPFGPRPLAQTVAAGIDLLCELKDAGATWTSVAVLMTEAGIGPVDAATLRTTFSRARAAARGTKASRGSEAATRRATTRHDAASRNAMPRDAAPGDAPQRLEPQQSGAQQSEAQHSEAQHSEAQHSEARHSGAQQNGAQRGATPRNAAPSPSSGAEQPRRGGTLEAPRHDEARRGAAPAVAAAPQHRTAADAAARHAADATPSSPGVAPSEALARRARLISRRTP